MQDNGIVVLIVIAGMIVIAGVAIALLRRRLTTEQAAEIGAVAASILASLGVAFTDGVVRAIASDFYRTVVHSKAISEQMFVDLVLRMVRMGRHQTQVADRFAVRAGIANARPSETEPIPSRYYAEEYLPGMPDSA